MLYIYNGKICQNIKNPYSYTHSFLSTAKSLGKIRRLGSKQFLYFLFYVNSPTFLWAKQNLTKKMFIFSYSLLPKIFKLRRSSLRLVSLIKIVYNIVRNPLLSFKARESKFWLPPQEGKVWKIRKRRWKYGAGAGPLKTGGSWHFFYLIFARFIIFTFRIYFTLCKIVLCIWRKTFIFPVTILLWKKVILSCLKMNLKIFHKLR